MALACHAVLTSRIKGHHAYNHDYFVGEELICELEFTNKYSHNSIEVKSKNKDVTVGHVPEGLAAILFPLCKAWKIYIRMEKRVTNLGSLHSGGLFTEFYGNPSTHYTQLVLNPQRSIILL